MLKELVRVFQEDFNERKYWKRRAYVQNARGGGVLVLLRLALIRRAEAKKCARTGAGLPGECCTIEGRLNLPHGLNGIIIARNVCIGANVTIFQHVTIAEEDKSKKTIIEDDVMLGAGAVILNNAHIGQGARIGANAVVTEDVPPGATVVGVAARPLGGALG